MNTTRKTVSPDRNSSSVFEQMCIKHNVTEERRKETGSKWEGAVEGRELMAQSQVCAPPRLQCVGAKQCVQPTGDEGAIPVATACWCQDHGCQRTSLDAGTGNTPSLFLKVSLQLLPKIFL